MEQTKDYIRLAADLQSDSIVDGPGLRTVIWTQGCRHHCKGCQNPQTWSFKGGGMIDINAVKEAIDELENQSGITFSGGDPMYQPYACYELAKYCKNKEYMKFLKNIDVLVDGRFEINNRDLNLLFRGSTNQRLIDVKKTLEKNEVVLFDENAYNNKDVFEKTKLYV